MKKLFIVLCSCLMLSISVFAEDDELVWDLDMEAYESDTEYYSEETEGEVKDVRTQEQGELEESLKALVSSNYFSANYELKYGYSVESIGDEGQKDLKVKDLAVSGLISGCQNPKRFHVKAEIKNDGKESVYETYKLFENDEYLRVEKDSEGNWIKSFLDKNLEDLLEALLTQKFDATGLEISSGGSFSDKGDNFKVLSISFTGSELYNWLSNYKSIIVMASDGKLVDYSILNYLNVDVYYSYNVNTLLPDRVEIAITGNEDFLDYFNSEGKEYDGELYESSLNVDFNYESEEIPLEIFSAEENKEEKIVEDFKLSGVSDYGSIDNPAPTVEWVQVYVHQKNGKEVPALLYVEKCEYDIRARELIDEVNPYIDYEDKDVYLLSYTIRYPNEVASLNLGTDEFTPFVKDWSVVSVGKNSFIYDGSYGYPETVFLYEGNNETVGFNESKTLQEVVLLPKYYPDDFVLKVGTVGKEAYIFIKNGFMKPE